MISLKTVSMEPVAKEDSRARAVYDRVATKTQWLTYEIKL